MRRLFTLMTGILFVFLVQAQAVGTLNVTVTTSGTGGNYAPKNIVAIWIEDADGHFVKTLLSYAQTYRTHLNMWQASTSAAGTEYNTVDAVTGATKTSHATRTCSWDATNYSGSVVPDGTYKLRMELTDKNGTGNYSTFTFTKSSTAQTLNPSNVPSFSSIYAVWTPDLTSVPQVQNSDGFSISPNPTDGIFTVTGINVQEIEILSITGNLIRKEKWNGTTANIDISSLPAGIYFIRVKTPKGYTTKKLFKN